MWICRSGGLGGLGGSRPRERGGTQPHPGELGPENRSGKQTPGGVGFEDVLNEDTGSETARYLFKFQKGDIRTRLHADENCPGERENKQTR